MLCFGLRSLYSLFQPTLPARGATTSASRYPSRERSFQPTLPARGATTAPPPTDYSIGISTHAPRTGSDLCRLAFRLNPQTHFNPRSPHGERPSGCFVGMSFTTQFQPTLPARGATYRRFGRLWSANNFNPRSPHGERRSRCPGRSFLPSISTHAPRTGSDASCICVKPFFARFQPTLPARGATQACPSDRRLPFAISTHAPRTGSDGVSLDTLVGRDEFQPTLPARGATSTEKLFWIVVGDFNPRSPHGERHRRARTPALAPCISTHAPRTGSDGQKWQSVLLTPTISTHAPRTGSDATYTVSSATRAAFQPTLPARGATNHLSRRQRPHGEFQPTLPARGATGWLYGCVALRIDFNPRSPHGERRGLSIHPRRYTADFNPRSPHGERQPQRVEIILGNENFNPRSPHGERPHKTAPPRRG